MIISINNRSKSVVPEPLQLLARKKATETSSKIRAFAEQNKNALQITSLPGNGVDSKEVAIKYITEAIDQADQAICEAVYDFSKEGIEKGFARILLQFQVRIVICAFRAGLVYQKPDYLQLKQAQLNSIGRKRGWPNFTSSFLPNKRSKAKITDTIEV